MAATVYSAGGAGVIYKTTLYSPGERVTLLPELRAIGGSVEVEVVEDRGSRVFVREGAEVYPCPKSWFEMLQEDWGEAACTLCAEGEGPQAGREDCLSCPHKPREGVPA